LEGVDIIDKQISIMISILLYFVKNNDDI